MCHTVNLVFLLKVVKNKEGWHSRDLKMIMMLSPAIRDSLLLATHLCWESLTFPDYDWAVNKELNTRKLAS